jgi:predicted transposase/invertase (TIGR01784 family)
MSRYLDPKTDIVFKKIFGQHPHLLKSFLTAVLPLPENGLIDSLEYLPSEQVPQIPSFKYTIVDVRCTDQQGRTFIVEMQIQWTTSFKQRMLFNASKAYVNQLEKGEHYHLLRPVYGLALINTNFDPY